MESYGHVFSLTIDVLHFVMLSSERFQISNEIYQKINQITCFSKYFVQYIPKTYLFSNQQGNPMDPMVMKRPQLFSVGNSPHTQTQPSSPYPGQSYGPPGPQRFPMGMQTRTPGSMGGMQYPQQQVCEQILCVIPLLGFLHWPAFSLKIFKWYEPAQK